MTIQGRVGSLLQVGTGFHSELTLSTAETRFITALKLDNADCDASGVFQIGGTVLFELELYSPERIKQPRLGIAVWTPRGERIATLHTAVQQRPGLVCFEGRLRAVWDNVPLNTGGHRVDISLWSTNRELETLTGCASLVIKAKDVYGTGRLPDSSFQGYLVPCSTAN